MGWKHVLHVNSRDKGTEVKGPVPNAISKHDSEKATLRSKLQCLTKVMGPKSTSSPQEDGKTEIEVDPNDIATLIGVIQDSMQEQQEASDKRWPRKLQWPSQKYLHASWVHTCQQLLQQAEGAPNRVPGEVKVAPANAGHVACLGPCLLQSLTPVHTLIVHGDLEYCTLLGHRLHVDLAVYFAALRTLAGFLKGNTHLRELVFAFTGSPIYVTDKTQQPVMEGFACEVLPAFEQALAENETLKYVSFRICYKPTPKVNVRRMCATSFEANCRQRAAVLSARHSKVEGASPLASELPSDVLKTILDIAFPLPSPPRVDFEFIHQRSSSNECRFFFHRLGRPTE